MVSTVEYRCAPQSLARSPLKDKRMLCAGCADVPEAERCRVNSYRSADYSEICNTPASSSMLPPNRIANTKSKPTPASTVLIAIATVFTIPLHSHMFGISFLEPVTWEVSSRSRLTILRRIGGSTDGLVFRRVTFAHSFDEYPRNRLPLIDLAGSRTDTTVTDSKHSIQREQQPNAP